MGVSNSLSVLTLAPLFVAACTQTLPSVPGDEVFLDVSYIAETPKIDGLLDEGLERLPVLRFSEFYTFDNPDVPPVTVTYRLGYTAEHLYVFIETDAEDLSFHGRGYVWGDGYKLLLALPGEGDLADEYIDIGVSPSENRDDHRSQNSILAYNGGQDITQTLTMRSQTRNARFDGGTGFEALIAWADIPPYHPWFVDRIGFNLYFAKGFDTAENGYFPNGYAVIHDEGIWDEEVLERAFIPLVFEAPSRLGDHLLVYPETSHVRAGGAAALNIMAGVHARTNNVVTTALTDHTGTFLEQSTFEVGKGNETWPLSLSMPKMPLTTGLYEVTVEMGDQIAAIPIGVLPDPDVDAIRLQISANENALSQTVVETLLFKLEAYQSARRDLKPYETGQTVIRLWEDFQSDFNVFTSGRDPYADRTSEHRRSFRSELDGTLQPYSLKLPDGFDPAKTYPLLVILHGSGRDERGLLEATWTDRDVIMLAPFGRDKYRAYAEPESQIDIVEAISRVRADFKIQPDRILVGGFSMGGYGALRAFYENPSLYAGVFVFAGHPNLASVWLDEQHPNFTTAEDASVFSGTPVFIYHGEKDAALDIELMREAAAVLEAAGAKVELNIDPERGHQFPGEDILGKFDAWIGRLAPPE